MTTGRINQVTTESKRMKSTFDQSSSRLLNAEPNTARTSFVSILAVLEKFSSLLLMLRRRSLVADDKQHRLFSVRLPNTPCEVGIFKTVEFV